MSYLGPLRLHFAGKFQAAPSTVNNDPMHYDNATFDKATDWKLQTKTAMNGWWNPMGDASWRLLGLKVTSAFIDNAAVPPSDPILGYSIADSDTLAPAKIVDLDPEQQMVSEVWGLHVRIARADGSTVLSGDYTPAPFTDLWFRATGRGADSAMCVVYQSVLTNLQWGDISDSPFLKALHAHAADGLLSIKWNVDQYNMQFGTPDFTLGRMVGSIGPASASEPQMFIAGRHLMPAPIPFPPPAPPAVVLNYAPAIVDTAAGKIYLDLGNSLRCDSTGAMVPAGNLSLVYTSGADSNGNPTYASLGTIPYLDADWYAKTAGVVVLPADRKLTPAELNLVKQGPLGLVATGTGPNGQTMMLEPAGGLYVRADQFVFRMDPGDRVEAKLYATQFGQPYPKARVISFFDGSQLQGGGPVMSTPLSAVEFPSCVVTGLDGIAHLPIQGSDPGNPRGFIDGQVYGIRPVLEDTLAYGSGYFENSSDFISILLWNKFPVETPWTWYGSIQPILQQYTNLYPVMSRFLDMSDYDSVCNNLVPLTRVFGLPVSDPNSMPVTRDLSQAKRAAINAWLANRGPDGKPLKGVAPAPAPPVALAASAPSADPAHDVMSHGGKSIALSRRRMLQRPVAQMQKEPK